MWPRNVALALAVLILGTGAWASLQQTSAKKSRDSRRRKLEAKRELLFERVTALEERHRNGGVDARQYAIERRQGMITIPVGAFADPDFPPPTVEVYGERRCPWLPELAPEQT